MMQLQRSKRSDGGLPFWRYSKVCLLEWLACLALVILGIIYSYIMIIVGIVLVFVFPILNEIVLNTVAKCCQRDNLGELIRKQLNDKQIFPIVYSAGYNITACGIEKLHPFDSTKYRRIWQFLHQSGIFEDLEGSNFWQPSLPNRHFLLEVMSW